MNQVGTKFNPNGDEKYTVVLPEEDYLIVVAGTFYDSAGSRFEHPNIAAKQNRLYEFKHYRRNGSKFWTSKTGLDFLFVIPKDKILLVNEKGYSYVPIFINGKDFHINTSGGGAAEWTDWVRQYAHVGCDYTQKVLHKLAEVALSPNECKSKGITIDLRKLTENEINGFVESATKQIYQSKLDAGHKVILFEGYHINDSKGPFEIDDRYTSSKGRKLNKWLVDCYRITPKHINWIQTAKANNMEIPEPKSVKYI